VFLRRIALAGLDSAWTRFFNRETRAEVVCLLGNHEDWLRQHARTVRMDTHGAECPLQE